MKKFGLLLGAFLILTGLGFWDNGLTDIYTRFDGARVCFYLTQYESLDLGAFSNDVIIIRNGAGVIVDAPAETAAALRRGFSDIKGESAAFDGDCGDARKILKFYRVNITGRENIPLDMKGNSILIIYGYSKLLTNGVEIDGDNVNIQIAVNSLTGKVTVGTPLILGSY